MTPPTPETLSRLITENLSMIFWHARRINKDRADDIVQEACLKIMRSTTYEDRGDASTKGWIRWHVISAGHAILRQTNLRLNPVWLEENATRTTTQPEQEYVTDLHELERRAAALPARQRAAVELMLQDNEYSEIGRRLGVSKQAAFQLVSRAKPALRLAA